VARRTWSNDTPYNVLGRHLKRLGISLLVGGIYDTVLGLWGLFWPESLAALLGIDLPPERFYFYLWPLLHAVFACFGFMAWMDVKRNIAIVTAAMVGRVVYALFMFAAVWRLDISWVWAAAGGISLALAMTHGVYLRKSDFTFWEVLSRAGNPPGIERR
jgi:drug/metabolite transporter superfamily protein YnfA